MTDYRYVSMNDLREDLKRVDALTGVLNIDNLSDDMVLLIHHQVSLAGHRDAPDWFKSEVEFWINLERNVAIDHQMKIEQLEARVHELEARLNINIDSLYDYDEAI